MLLALLAAMITAPLDPVVCNVPLVSQAPAATTTAAQAPVKPNGLGILYTGAGMAAPYEMSVTLTLPKSSRNIGIFYTNWLLLASRDSPSFLQIELMRWSKYGYRNEIALTWAQPDGTLVYRDTPLFVWGDGYHRLTIRVTGRDVQLFADDKVACSAAIANFFRPSERLYYQIGNEVKGKGDMPTGKILDIEASDAMHTRRRVIPQCQYTAYGLSWLRTGTGAEYVAQGSLDYAQPAKFFGGCVLEPWPTAENSSK